MKGTFGMLHLVFKGDRAPPLPGRIPVVLLLMRGGVVDGEVVQQHHVCACAGGKQKSPTERSTLTKN